MYGIDFGTSNTVVTWAPGPHPAHSSGTAREGGPRVLDLGDSGPSGASGLAGAGSPGGGEVLPSLLYFERDRRASVGHEAMADYSEALLRHRGTGNLYTKFRFFQALKLALKDRFFEGTNIFGEYLAVETLAAIFLREVRRRADLAVLASGGAPDGRLVLGRPVLFDADPAIDRKIQDRFEKAALLAGFEEVAFVAEPVGAAVNALGGRGGTDGVSGAGAAKVGGSQKGDILLVFDFGGGTLDISVARASGGGLSILSTAGRDLGGYLLDADISRARITRHFGSEGRFRTMTGRELEMPRWITDQVASFYALPLADIAKTRAAIKDLMYDARAADKPKLRGLLEFLDRNLSFELFDRIDNAKIELSSAEKARIEWAVRPHVAFAEELSRLDFEALVRPRVEAARELVLEALGRARLEPRQVDRVVRVGGSSRVPAFVRMLEGLFPGRVEEGEVFTSIASGLLEARERGLAMPSG